MTNIPPHLAAALRKMITRWLAVPEIRREITLRKAGGERWIVVINAVPEYVEKGEIDLGIAKLADVLDSYRGSDCTISRLLARDALAEGHFWVLINWNEFRASLGQFPMPVEATN